MRPSPTSLPAARQTIDRLSPPRLVIIGEGPVAATLAAAAGTLGITAVTVLGTTTDLVRLHPPASPGNPAMVVIADTPIPGEADFIEPLRRFPEAGVRIVPEPDLWEVLWSSPSPHLWLQRQGLPAVPPSRCARTGDSAGTDSNQVERFLLPLAITARGDHVVLPLLAKPRVTARQPQGGTEPVLPGVTRFARRGHASAPALSAGIRKRSHAIAACLAQRLGTTGVFAIEYTALPEDSVHINRVLRFSDLACLLDNEAAQSSLARIHLAALFDLPLPDFTD